MKENVSCDCPYCFMPVHESATVCPHCTRDIPNPSGVVLGDPVGDAAEVVIKLGIWTVIFSIAICTTISELDLPRPSGEWVLLLVILVAFVISCFLYKKLPPKY